MAIVVVAGTGAPALAQSGEAPDEPVAQELSVEARSFEAARRRGQILVMETALVQAIRNGANRLITQLSRATQAEPGSILMGPPTAQGFALPEYGVVFTVKVPGMSGILLYALPWVMEQRRAQLQPRRSPSPPSEPVGIFGTADDSLLRDPDAAYVSSIQAALIEAMLENSSALRLQPEERLTVVARQDAQPDPFDPTAGVRTMHFTVKGRDLDAFHRKQLRLEEAQKLVTVTVD